MAANSLVDMATSLADRAAARLAAVPGIRRAPTPKLEQFMLARFLDAETCAALIAQIDRDVRPSTIADPNGDEAFRTSTTCDLDHRDPLVRAVRTAHRDLFGNDLELVRSRVATNAVHFVQEAGIPAVGYGPDHGTNHSDHEVLPVAELSRIAGGYALATARWLDEVAG